VLFSCRRAGLLAGYESAKMKDATHGCQSWQVQTKETNEHGYSLIGLVGVRKGKTKKERKIFPVQAVVLIMYDTHIEICMPRELGKLQTRSRTPGLGLPRVCTQ
jgi:hypothetical protein